jgi:hypothetical protein
MRRNRSVQIPFLALLLIATFLFAPPPNSHAFSVLAHQAIVDQAWKDQLVPLIRKRFPNASDQDLSDARSYARAGSHLPDLGYFPLGSREFTDLLHYVRSGDFINRLIAESNSIDEYAFALGVMAHYEGDTVGHPLATNLAVPIIFPKLKNEYGDTVTYAEDPSAHLQTEFRFDILQVAHRHEVPDLFEHSIEFKVPKDFLNRVFKETYGLELNDLFTNFDVALTTYRWGFRTLIDETTGIAWQLYREDINSLEPGVVEKDFIQVIPRGDFEKEFGHAFLEPGYFARFFGLLGNLVPNVGPLTRLPYRPLPPQARILYFGAFKKVSMQYQEELTKVDSERLELPDLFLDTGGADVAGVYPPADKAYAQLLRLHAKDHFARVPNSLAAILLKHFHDRDLALKFEQNSDEKESAQELQDTLTALNDFESRESRLKQEQASAVGN